jgi:hypothetical protein
MNPTETSTTETTPTKPAESPTPNHDTELTKLMTLWQKLLSEDKRNRWRLLFISPNATAADIRDLIRQHLKIDLQQDRELYVFRDWEMTQRLYVADGGSNWDEQRQLMREHPEWDLAPTFRVHEDFLREMHLHTILSGNYALGLRAIHAEVQYRTLELNREKFKESFRHKYLTSLDLLDKECRKHPLIKDALKKLRQAITAQYPRSQ